MSKLRKYPKMVPAPRKSWFTIDRTLLAGVVALTAFGGLQMSAVNVASNDKQAPTDAGTLIASRPAADYTPVGSIEAVDKAQKEKDAQRLQAPMGLRNARQ